MAKSWQEIKKERGYQTAEEKLLDIVKPQDYSSRPTKSFTPVTKKAVINDDTIARGRQNLPLVNISRSNNNRYTSPATEIFKSSVGPTAQNITRENAESTSNNVKKKKWTDVKKERGYVEPEPVIEDQWKEHPFKSAGSFLWAGLGDLGRGTASVIDMTLGDKNIPIVDRYLADAKKDAAAEDARLAKIDQSTGKAGQFAGQVFRGVGQSLPSVGIGIAGAPIAAANPLLTAGGTQLVNNAAALANPTLAMTTQKVLTDIAKNPNLIPSMVQSVGAQYDQAINAGATKNQAIKSAILGGVPSGMIEVMGGTDVLAEKLASKMPIGKVILGSGLGEAFEEILQYPIENLGQKISYDSKMPYFSTKENAVFNPGQQLYNGATAFASSALMGGVGSVVNSGINKHYSNLIDTEYKKIINDLPEDSPIMDRIKEIQDNGAKVTDEVKVWAINSVMQEQGLTQDNVQSKSNVIAQQMVNENKPIEQIVKNDETFAKAQNNSSASNNPILNAFQIQNVKNAREVKQNIYNFYKDSIISDSQVSKPIVNKYTGMNIEVSRATINQTFGTDDKFKNNSDNEIKVAAMEKLPDIIQNGQIEIVGDNKTSTSKDTYATIKSSVAVNGIPYDITLDIRRTDNGNKYFVHSLHTESSQTANKVSSIIHNGYEQSISKEAYPILDKVAQALGVKIVAVPQIDITDDNSNVLQADVANGQYDKNTNTIEISMKANNPVMEVAKHELTHRLQQQSPKLYQEYKDYVVSAMKEKGTYQNVFSDTVRIYKNVIDSSDISSIEDEIVSDAAGALFTDKTSIDNIAQNNPTLGKKILSIIREIIKKIDDTVSKAADWLGADQLKKAEQLWATALNDAIGKENNIVENQAAVTQMSVKDDNIGYHAGDLGKADYLNIMPGRGTGHFGTGTYFVGNEKDIDIGTYKDRPRHAVSFEGYNLYKPKTVEEGRNLHKFLKSINDMSFNSGYKDVIDDILAGKVDDEYIDNLISEKFPYISDFDLNVDLSKEFEGKDIDDIEEMLKQIDKKISETNIPPEVEERKRNIERYQSSLNKLINNIENVKQGLKNEFKFSNDKIINTIKELYKYGTENLSSKKKIDSPSTAFMKSLGYEGVDVRGLKGLDDTEFGSVIYDINKDSVKYSLKDSDGRELTTEQQTFFKNSKVRDAKGNLLVMYHGTPNASFTKFRTGTYFTQNKEYADNYQNPNASSISIKQGVNNPGIYEVYLNIKKPFDTRKAKERKIFNNEYYNKYGMGTPLMESGLPDWFDGMDLQDFIEEKGYDYDGLILDEGGTGGYGDEVKSRGFSYVVFNSNQVKNVTNIKPTSNPDIRYQLKDNQDSKEVERLQKVNANLKEQFKLTKGIKLDEKSIKKLARTMLKDYSSKYSKTDLETKMFELYNDIANNDIEYEEMTQETQAIARDIIENASVLNDSMSKQYNELRSTLRNTDITIADRFKDDFNGGYDAFRKKNYGRINLTKDGMNVDVLYQELAETYPELFSKEISNQADQLMLISDVLDGLVPIYENPFNRDMNEATELLALEIFEDFTNVPEAKPTFADKQKSKLDNAKTENKEKIKALKAENKDNIDWIKQQNKEKINNFVEKEKTKRDKAVEKVKKQYSNAEYKTWWTNKLKENDIRSHYQEMVKDLRSEKNMKIEQTASKYRERIGDIYEDRKVKETKSSIERKVKRLGAMLKKPTQKQHIPKIMTKSIADLLAQIDFTTDRQQEATVLKLRDLAAEYKKMAEVTDDQGLQATADPYTLQALETLNGVRLADMSLKELEILKTIVAHFEHLVKTYNKAFVNGKWVDIRSKAIAISSDLATDKPVNESAYGVINNFKDMLQWGMVTPQMFFERMGNTFGDMFKDFRAALDVKINNTKITQDYMSKLLENSRDNIKEWTGKKTKPTTFRLEGGNTIELTPAQVMSLYLLFKREQARGHILGLGIKAAPIVEVDNKGIKHLKKQFEPAKVTLNDITKILGSMTKEQKKIADGIGVFMNTTSKQWVNEATLKMYGYELAQEENYFPIKSDSDFLKSDFDNTNLDPTFTSMGFLKATIKGAGNAIIVDDIFNVFTEHADKAATYNAFAGVAESTKKIINYKTETDSIKQSMSRKYGTQAFNYLKKFMVDLQGGVRVEGGPPIVNALIRNTKRTVLGLNMRTVIQQPTAIVRASAMIDVKYLIKGIAMKGNLQEVLEHSPIAMWKSWGYFNLDTGRSMKDIILNTTPILDKQYDMIQKADDITWAKLWNACKLEINDTMPSLKEGSKEYFEAVNARFDDIIDRTQVVDTVMHRSDIMRQKDSGWKILTAFMAEPTKSYNMLLNAKEKYDSHKTEENKKAMLRTTSAWIATTLINTFIISLVDMYRDDKKELKDTWLGNILNDVTGMVPLVRDIYSLLQGYSIKRMEYNGIEKIARSVNRTSKYVQEMASDEKHAYPIRLITKDWIESVAYVFGVGAGNVSREIEALLMNYIKVTGNEKGAANDVYNFMFVK